MAMQLERGRAVDGAWLWDGSLGPSEGSPTRVPGSIRRTTTVDILWPEGVAGTTLELVGRARDLRTTTDGRAEVLHEASSRVLLRDGVVAEVATTPSLPVDALLGVPGRRLRGALTQHLPHLTTDGSLIGLLLDEVPVTLLISGHARSKVDPKAAGSHAEAPPALTPVDLTARPDKPTGKHPTIDVCIGWAAGGFMSQDLERRRRGPAHPGVTMPPMTVPGDPVAWHERPEDLPGGSMRRNRRLDVARRPDGTLSLEGVFRDQYWEPGGRTTGVHEYAMAATVGPDGRLLAIEALPLVLPGPECPGAVASAQRLVGRLLAELRPLVRSDFHGTTTCTHLNDELRSLGDAHALVALL